MATKRTPSRSRIGTGTGTKIQKGRGKVTTMPVGGYVNGRPVYGNRDAAKLAHGNAKYGTSHTKGGLKETRIAQTGRTSRVTHQAAKKGATDKMGGGGPRILPMPGFTQPRPGSPQYDAAKKANIPRSRRLSAPGPKTAPRPRPRTASKRR